MPNINWKSFAIGGAAVYAFLWWQAKKTSSTTSA